MHSLRLRLGGGVSDGVCVLTISLLAFAEKAAAAPRPRAKPAAAPKAQVPDPPPPCVSGPERGQHFGVTVMLKGVNDLTTFSRALRVQLPMMKPKAAAVRAPEPAAPQSKTMVRLKGDEVVVPSVKTGERNSWAGA